MHRSLAAGRRRSSWSASSRSPPPSPTGEHVQPAVLIGGILAVVVGVVLAAPGGDPRSRRCPPRRLPFAPRLALRDLARYQARAAAALAAITLALGIAVSIVVIVAKANEHRGDEGNLSDRQLVISVGDPRTAPEPDARTRPTGARLDARGRDGRRRGRRLDAADRSTSRSTRRPPATRAAANRSPRRRRSTTASGSSARPYVATPELLAPLRHRPVEHRRRHRPADRRTTATSCSSTPASARSRASPQTHVQRVDLPSFTVGADLARSPNEALRRHGWATARAGWLVESASPLTAAADRRRPRRRPRPPGSTIEVRDSAGRRQHACAPSRPWSAPCSPWPSWP